jgi:transcriptional regulator with XRE-family HTH domain
MSHGTEAFGETLKRIRRMRGSQKEVATKIPMDLGYFSRLENGKLNYPPSRDTIVKIANALECTKQERHELLVAAGRIDEEIEGFAQLASRQPEFRRLFKAISQLDAESLQDLLNDIDPSTHIERQKGVAMMSIEAPAPSKYVSYTTVEEVAAQCVDAYRKETKERRAYSIDPVQLAEVFKIRITWQTVVEPPEAIFFACYIQQGHQGQIQVNKAHRQFFETRSDIYRATIGHEIGHCILNHHALGALEESGSLFPDLAASTTYFHKASLFPYGLSQSEVQRLKVLERKVQEKLVKTAAVDNRYRDRLHQLNSKFEPTWMFRQAEHFARCLLIPKDRIRSLLEGSWDFNSWTTVYKWAELFEVSASMMRSRLEKLGIIEIGPDGRPRLGANANQKSLF